MGLISHAEGHTDERADRKAKRPSEEPLRPERMGALQPRAAAEAAGEEADHPDQRDHGGDDEEPVDHEAGAECEQRQDGKCNEAA